MTAAASGSGATRRRHIEKEEQVVLGLLKVTWDLGLPRVLLLLHRRLDFQELRQDVAVLVMQVRVVVEKVEGEFQLEQLLWLLSGYWRWPLRVWI